MEVLFLVVGALGLGVLVLSLLVGEIGDLGDADGAFSVPALAALLGGVGFGRAVLALAAGLVVAVPLAWAAVRLSRGLRDMPTAETPTRHHLVGTQGVVVSAVPSPGYGEVRLVLAGQQLKFAARSDTPLPAGTPVYVVEARLTIEEIIRDRAAFASAVAEEAESSLTGQGLVLDTFQLQDIQAEGSYLADLGRPEAARVLEEASIAEARARQAAQQEQLLADEAIAVAQRQLALRQAETTAETDAAAARAAAAGPLAQAAQDQAILTEQEKVAVRTAALTERQLDTQVRRPADAQRYKVEQEAEARKNAAILTAEAEAVEGAKRGEAEKLRRQAIADAVEREGSAEAAAILARGQAEAEALDARSEAFAKYGEAAVLEMLVKVLPEVVQAAAAPLAGVDKMTVISADGAGSLGRSVAANVAQGLQLSGASPAWTSRRCCASSVVRRPPPTASRRSRSPRTGKSQPGRGGPITGAGGSPIGTRAAAQRQSGTARGRGVVR